MNATTGDGLGKPLAGIKVLDLTRVLAGPFATRMLSDLGADVVKIEPPEGDVTRHFGIRVGEQSSYYAFTNVGKRGVCVDLTVDGGVDLVKRLAVEADIVVENFRPGVLAGFGLDYESLSADHPELLMLSISGFGQAGPESQRAAYAGVIHAESGFTHRHGLTTGAPPTDIQFSVADTTTGLHGLVGLLSALRVRDQTGQGQHIDMAMLDALMVTDDYFHWASVGRDAPPLGGEVWHPAGGPVIVMGEFKWIWKCANETLGVADPTPPGASLDEKIECRREAWREYVATFADRESFLAALDHANLAWGIIRDPKDAMNSPTLAHRGSLADVDDRAGSTRKVMQSPYRFSKSNAGLGGPAPLQGEHNRDVLADWLDDGGAYDDLVTKGILLTRDPLP